MNRTTTFLLCGNLRSMLGQCAFSFMSYVRGVENSSWKKTVRKMGETSGATSTEQKCEIDNQQGGKECRINLY
jgi:hypothetical protein